MRATHTFAELEVSAGTYDEISAKLKEAGYDHAFVRLSDGVAIDMHGIGLTRAPAPDISRSYGVAPRSAILAEDLGARLALMAGASPNDFREPAPEPITINVDWHIDGEDSAGFKTGGEVRAPILDNDSPVAFLKTDKPLCVGMLDTVRARFYAQYLGMANAGGAMIVEPGFTLEGVFDSETAHLRNVELWSC